MKILVTGGAGFIGSHLCEALLKNGNDVICVDNFFTGNKDNVKHLLSNPNFELMRHDLVFPLFVEVDQIYNLACPAAPVHYQFNPIKTIKMGTIGMINMLGLAKRTGARILQASTSEVYGNPQVHPQTEGYWGNVNPIGKRSCYDEGKRVAESLMFAYHWQNNVDIKIVRIFNTYGPRTAKNDERVVSNFILQALQNEPLTVYGKGQQTRSFCYVSDTINGLIKMMNTEKGITGPINIGNPTEITILDLAKKIIELTGSKSEIKFEPLPEDDPDRRCPDITLARKILNWEPEVELDSGLRSTIGYFRKVI